MGEGGVAAGLVAEVQLGHEAAEGEQNGVGRHGHVHDRLVARLLHDVLRKGFFHKAGNGKREGKEVERERGRRAQ